jgi:broad specificity phosphatase PhoE
MSEPTPTSVPARGRTAEREANESDDHRARIFLIRHGEPDWSPDGGPSVPDPALTSFGRAQALATAEIVAPLAFDALYASPCLRAQQTAAAVAEATGMSPVTIDDLAEIGIATGGLSLDAVDRYFVEALQRPLEEHWDGWPGAETFHDFHGRVTRGIGEVLAQQDFASHPRGELTAWKVPHMPPTIGIVAHSGTNAVIITHLLDVSPVPWEWLRFGTGLAAYSMLEARPIGQADCVWSLESFKRHEHLASQGMR